MTPIRLVPALLLLLAYSVSSVAADAVLVDGLGNTTFSGSVAVIGQVTAPNVLQGAPGTAVNSAVALSTLAFGQWHWITGTSTNYTITLPTAVGNTGKSIGFRVMGVSAASKIYTLAASNAEMIDGATTIPLVASTALVIMSDGVGWARIGGSPTPVIPSGSIVPSAGGAVPTGWLECNGQVVSRAAYPVLFAAIGTTWGLGDGSTTFNVPNFSRRTLVGRGGTGTTVLGNILGAIGGEETHVLTIAEMPSHTHGIPYSGNDGYDAIAHSASTSGTVRFNSDPAGGNAPHNLMQPSAVVVYLIKY
jgi:microcystin-dependent protein